jgi:hypothetical protein
MKSKLKACFFSSSALREDRGHNRVLSESTKGIHGCRRQTNRPVRSRMRAFGGSYSDTRAKSAGARQQRGAGSAIRMGRVSLRTAAEFAYPPCVPASGQSLPPLVRGPRSAAAHGRARPRWPVTGWSFGRDLLEEAVPGRHPPPVRHSVNPARGGAQPGRVGSRRALPSDRRQNIGNHDRTGAAAPSVH